VEMDNQPDGSEGGCDYGHRYRLITHRSLVRQQTVGERRIRRPPVCCRPTDKGKRKGMGGAGTANRGNQSDVRRTDAHFEPRYDRDHKRAGAASRSVHCINGAGNRAEGSR